MFLVYNRSRSLFFLTKKNGENGNEGMPISHGSSDTLLGCDVKSAEVCGHCDWLIFLSRCTHTEKKKFFGTENKTSTMAAQAQNFYLSSDNLPELEPSLTSSNGADSEFFNDIDGRCSLCISFCLSVNDSGLNLLFWR